MAKSPLAGCAQSDFPDGIMLNNRWYTFHPDKSVVSNLQGTDFCQQLKGRLPIGSNERDYLAIQQLHRHWRDRGEAKVSIRFSGWTPRKCSK